MKIFLCLARKFTIAYATASKNKGHPWRYRVPQPHTDRHSIPKNGGLGEMEAEAGNRKRTTKRSHYIAGIALAVMCVLVPAIVQGQELRGKITGRVMDAS